MSCKIIILHLLIKYLCWWEHIICSLPNNNEITSTELRNNKNINRVREIIMHEKYYRSKTFFEYDSSTRTSHHLLSFLLLKVTVVTVVTSARLQVFLPPSPRPCPAPSPPAGRTTAWCPHLSGGRTTIR